MTQQPQSGRLADKAREMGAKDIPPQNDGGQQRRLRDLAPTSGSKDFPFNTDAILGKDVQVLEVEERMSDFRNTTYIVMLVELDGRKVYVSCGGNVVKREILRNRELLPFTIKIVKKGRVYDIE